jgi:LacI family transcriptional regulator
MPVTQEEIAQKVGVSRRLVGYALNGHPNINAETRQRIQDTAERMGYRPNRVAQALASGRTYQIALCFPFLGSSFYNEFIRQFEMLLRPTPYNLLIVTYGDKKGTQRLNLTVDGTLFIGPTYCVPPEAVLPVIVMQNQLYQVPENEDSKYDTIQIETEEASFLAMAHLISQGHQRIAYLAPEEMVTEIDLRYHAYRRVMKEAGLREEVISLPICAEELLRQQSHRMLRRYFEAKGFPDALFCCNDDLGIGAYRAAADLGRRIPEDMAVLGFDDLDEASYLSPPMSSVRMPIQEVCRRAWDMLQQRIDDADSPAQYESFKASLVVRASSAGGKSATST